MCVFAFAVFAGNAHAQDEHATTTALTEENDEAARAEWEQEQLRNTALADPADEPSRDKIADYLRKYRETNIYDPVLAVYDIRATAVPETTNGIELAGEVSLVWYKSGTEKMLRSLGFEVTRNDVRVLPDKEFKDLPYAVSTTASATMRKHTDMSSEQVNAIPLGWPIRLLREATETDKPTTRPESRRRRNRERAAEPPYEGKWFLAQSSDAYIGFVRDDQVSRTAVYRLPDAVLVKPMEAHGHALPTGTGLYRSHGGSQNSYQTTLDNRFREVKPRTDMVTRYDRTLTSKKILQIADPLLNTGYTWGGTTNNGIDCSGFTQFVYNAMGIFLPRDARPQSVVGRISSFGENAERDAAAGDLVYFADTSGRISHIGIALGDGKVIHSAGELGVHVGDYHEKSRSRPNGMLERVLYTRRVTK